MPNTGIDWRRRRNDDRGNPDTFIACHPMMRARFRQWRNGENQVVRAIDLHGVAATVDDILYEMQRSRVYNPPDRNLTMNVLATLVVEGILTVDDGGHYWFAAG